MDPQTERRRSAREGRSVPKIGALYYPLGDPSSSVSPDRIPYFVDLLDENRDGFLAQSDSALEAGTLICLGVYAPKDKSWSPFQGRVAWCAPAPQKEGLFHLGLAGPAGGRAERKMTTLFLFYREDHRLALNALLEEFSRKVKETGIALKVAEIKDIE